MARFKVFRYTPGKDKAPRFDRYEVPTEKGMTVLEGLYYILENKDGSLAFRSSCRASVCGSCAMHINGKYRLACNTLIESLIPNEVARVERHRDPEVRPRKATPFGKSRTIVVQPLAHLSILRDLVVDLTNFFRHYEEIKPYLLNGKQTPEKEFTQSPKERKKIDGMVDCILCAACFGSCPIGASDPDYLGPHALMKAARFIYDSRDQATEERLQLVAHSKGLFRCHTVFNCQTACPKDLDPSGAIARLKRRALWHAIRKFLHI